MKKRILKIITIALTAVIAINNFYIKKPASAAETISIETEEVENFDRQLIYEHENENGLIERVYLKNIADNYATNSRNLDLTFELSDNRTHEKIAENQMYTSWAYGGAVPTYPYLAYYRNTPYPINASRISYQSSATYQKKKDQLYCTKYDATLSYTYQGNSSNWICSLTFCSDGTYFIS